jgi:tol-pal system protein YbgF
MCPLRNQRGSRFCPGSPAFYLLLLLLASLLGGCATRREISSFQEDTQYIRQTLDSLNQSVQSLRLQVDSMQIRQDRIMDQMVTQSDLRQYKAYMGSRMDDQQGQLQVLSAQVSDLAQHVTGVSQRVDEMKYTIKSTSAVDTSAAGDTVEAEPRQLYDQAYLDLSRGNYDLAKGGFEEYLRLYADTELADNAQYWLGEVEYVQGNFEAAISEFRQVESKYPQGNKVPAALFKAGLCQLQLKEKREARVTFRDLIQRYPAAPEAAQARDRLKDLR